MSASSRIQAAYSDTGETLLLRDSLARVAEGCQGGKHRADLGWQLRLVVEGKPEQPLGNLTYCITILESR
jgi:hypothetical protein